MDIANNCCEEEETVECCSNKAAVTLVGIMSSGHSTTQVNESSLKAGTKSSSEAPADDVQETPAKESTDKTNILCPKRRKRSVSVDFSDPCDCCPSGPTKKIKRTFVDDLSALADFLKKERKVLKSTEPFKIDTFYELSENDTELVAEWKRSGSQVYASMVKKLARLEDMEAKFGSWEEHFA